MTALIIFAAAYSLNMYFITVFYHRGLAHKALVMPDRTRRFVARAGIWFTGMDPKAWACMHRLHHQFADHEGDPHSPNRYGMFLGLIRQQFTFYRKLTRELAAGNPEFTKIVRDLDFDVHWTSHKQLLFLPYLVQGLVGVGIAVLTQAPWIGLAYYLGIMSHPIQGWAVNSFGHQFGYRTFKTSDNSRNNLWIAILIFGEGLQNNHHHHPRRANMAMKWWEPDPGYWLCKLGFGLGWIKRC